MRACVSVDFELGTAVHFRFIPSLDDVSKFSLVSEAF